ncbi:hypothetical protein RMSM_07009 [Rhodopirellula maiorica SM1]|uniref:Uncharacterized protein n=1 Tax=Rhodopirellula maiorica SM1 TaxID=1265738 RepID=M5RL14_9BACT|nr:hypothetical protein RMSM_07009 [Rhodopirellula maiorica SM1]
MSNGSIFTSIVCQTGVRSIAAQGVRFILVSSVVSLFGSCLAGSQESFGNIPLVKTANCLN